MQVKSNLKSVATQPSGDGKQFVRANQIARSSRTRAPLIDISVATWWRWVASGRAPQPKRLSPGTTVWDLKEVIDFIKKSNGGAEC
jgi:predicted DNA-binding transcriptional regulator AlpA